MEYALSHRHPTPTAAMMERRNAERERVRQAREQQHQQQSNGASSANNNSESVTANNAVSSTAAAASNADTNAADTSNEAETLGPAVPVTFLPLSLLLPRLLIANRRCHEKGSDIV